MLRFSLAALPLLAVFTVSASAEDAAPSTTEVTLRALKLQIPETWKQSPSKSRMRLATFQIPGASEEQQSGELAIYNFPGGGGSVEDNIKRWVGQFQADGRKHTVSSGKADGGEYHLVEITGTYNQPVGPPIRRQSKAMPGSRMLGVILILSEGRGVYFLKMTGPDDTVKAQADLLRQSFGGSADSETTHQS